MNSSVTMPSYQINSGITIKSRIDTQSDIIDRLEKRLDNIETKLNDMQSFLDYKGFTKEEFNDFLESRKLADKMIRDQSYEFPYFKLEVKPIMPVDHIVFKYPFTFDASNELIEE